MQITVLTHLEKEGEKKYDIVVNQVVRALRGNGHTVSVLGVHGNVRRLISGLERREPDLIFNLMEVFGDSLLGAVDVVGLLDLLAIPYTGGGPGEYYLQEDKALTKKLLAFDGISYPDFAVIPMDATLETGGKLRMPLFVKPLRMEASIGVDAGSLVHNFMELTQRVQAIHQKLKDSALAEEYIEGREFYVGVIGNGEPQALPPVEMDFSKLPADMPHIVDARAKWAKKSAEYAGTRAVVSELAEPLRARLQRVALDAYRALRVRDYGRIDMRLTPADEIYVIEVNASCYLDESAEFAMAAAAAGIEYPALIEQIVTSAVERFRTQRRRRKPQPRRQGSGRSGP
jgi:D-alanine-D-alanine ligase